MSTYKDLVEKGWTITDIDNMDFLSYVTMLAYSASSKTKQAYIDDVLP